jgi:hypothetical protein
MTETESKWATRVAGWRASGQTAPSFCVGKEFKPGGLRYWASRLGKAGGGAVGAAAKGVRLARVVRASRSVEAVVETPILIEVGTARLGVRRGFDPGALRAVLDVLGGGR